MIPAIQLDPPHTFGPSLGPGLVPEAAGTPIRRRLPAPPPTLCLLPQPGRRPQPPAATPPFAGWRRYRRVELLDEGGMGRVFRAWDPALERTVALKFVRPGLAAPGRPLREAKLQAMAAGRWVPAVYDHGELAGHPYLAMALVDGVTLAAARRQMTLGERVELAVRLCAALDSIHRAGVIHRDVNPRNLLVRLTPKGGWQPTVIDFGIARELAGAESTDNARVVGTASYMAPEQALGHHHKTSPATDVYSLGATLYELFSGHRPFTAESSEATITKALREDPPPLAQLAPALPPGLGEVVRRCLEKRPGDRYPTATALAADLEAVRTERTAG
jgi:serine/threonine-protein kinase